MSLAHVQSVYAKFTFAATQLAMGSALTDGNKLYVFIMTPLNGTNAINTTDYTIESTNGPGGTTSTQYLLSRIVNGDGTAPPLVTTHGVDNICWIVAEEVSGGAAIESISQSTSEASPISGPTTVANNCLGMRASGSNGGFGTYGPGIGWTNRQYNTNASTMLDTTTSLVAAGTDLSGTVTNTVGGTTGHWMVVALKVASNTETGTGTLAFGALAFAAAGSGSDIGTGTLAFGALKFAASGTAQDIGVGVLQFGALAISGSGTDLGASPATKIKSRDTLAQERLQKLDWNQPIVDPNTGFPTPEMQRKWLRNLNIIEAQIKVNNSIVPKSYIDARDVATLGAAQTFAIAGDVATLIAAKAYADSLVTGGTVTSVGLSLPTEFTVSNSPVTLAGTLTAVWATKTAHYVLAGPTSGGAATPAFRLLVASDIPDLSASYDTAGLAAAAIVTAEAFSANAANITSGLLPDARLNNTITAGGPTGDASHVAQVTWDAHGRLTAVSSVAIAIAAGAVSGLAAVATSGSASDLGTGTLPAARLPNPSSSTLGGVESIAAVSHQWVASISTSGVPSLSQPAVTDLSDFTARTTWTPTDASGAGLSLTIVETNRIRIGPFVFVEGFITYPVTADASAAKIGGFPSAIIGNHICTMLSNTGLPMMGLCNDGTTNMSLRNSTTNANITNAQMSTNTIIFTAMYLS